MDGIIFSLEYTTHYYRHKDNMHIFMRDLAAALLWDSISQWSLFLPRCGSLNWAVIGGKKMRHDSNFCSYKESCEIWCRLLSALCVPHSVPLYLRHTDAYTCPSQSSELFLSFLEGRGVIIRVACSFQQCSPAHLVWKALLQWHVIAH